MLWIVSLNITLAAPSACANRNATSQPHFQTSSCLAPSTIRRLHSTYSQIALALSIHTRVAAVMYSLPETYYITKSTPYVPNSPLPVLVYRGALTSTPTAESIKALIEPNGWLQGGIFKHYPAHHFHSLTHECYAVFKGRSRLLLGKGPLDDATGDGMTDGNGDRNVEVTVGVGDAIVLPAGVAHCCLESEGEYEYVGLYPKVRYFVNNKPKVLFASIIQLFDCSSKHSVILQRCNLCASWLPASCVVASK